MFRSFRSVNIFVISEVKKIKFPNKLKGTIVEKWANYWKNLFIDYQQMIKDLRKDIQDDPKKALKWTVLIAAAYGLAANNPNELDFKDELKKMNNEIILVSEEIQNPQSIEHVRYLLSCYNEGVIYYRNFGLFSIMYTKDISDACNLYKAQCKYLLPTFNLDRIVDVGVMGRWWNFYIKTTDYDVNM